MRYSRRQELAVEAAERATGHGDHKRSWCGVCEEEKGELNETAWVVHEPSGFYWCFSCGDKGRLPGHEDDDEYTSAEDVPVDPLSLQAPEGFTLLSAPDEDLARARRYVVNRGISKRTAVEAQLGACLEGKFRGRVVVPVLGDDGRTWLGYQARLYRKAKTFTFDDGRTYTEPRYKNPPGPWRRSIVYNPAALQVSTTTPVIAVEGTFDALPYWPDAIAFLGKPLKTQVDLLLAAKRPIAICLDGDAWLEGQMFAGLLRMHGKEDVGFVRLPPGTDPNEASDWLREAAAESIGASLF